MTAGLPPPERDEGPAEADPTRTLEPSPESSYVTVTRYRLHDGQGAACLELVLPGHFDERAAANIVITPRKCVHVVAADDVDWTLGAVQRLVWRCAGRVPFVFDAVPEPLARVLVAELAAYLDHLGAAA